MSEPEASESVGEGVETVRARLVGSHHRGRWRYRERDTDRQGSL
jgi:hypothetical protein